MLFNLSTCNTMGPFIWKISFHLQFGPLFLFRSLICSIFLQLSIWKMNRPMQSHAWGVCFLISILSIIVCHTLICLSFLLRFALLIFDSHLDNNLILIWVIWWFIAQQIRYEVSIFDLNNWCKLCISTHNIYAKGHVFVRFFYSEIEKTVQKIV